ncbi:MAG: hypothetical protein HC927_05980 [Deltaproteobacteria bacterium]|nr:hypothetical protein [Deltaproteobacteria bacterium]
MLHELDGQAAYSAAAISTLEYVAILAAPGEVPRLQGNGAPGLTVYEDSTVYLRGVSVRQGDDVGVLVSGAVWIQQCRIFNNSGGGIVVDGGELVLENSFVGGTSSDVPMIQIATGTANIVYSTIGATAVSTSAIECVDGTGSTIRNSIVMFNNGDDPNGGELICPNIELVNNALEGDFAGNVSLGNVSTMWFANFNNGDLALNPQTVPAILTTAATWLSGDPTTDIDGDPRSAMPGAADFAGADVF